MLAISSTAWGSSAPDVVGRADDEDALTLSTTVGIVHVCSGALVFQI
jgi:hypothetical protein